MAIQTPAHIHFCMRNCDGHFANFAMTGFTVEASCNVGAVHELDEIGHDRDRYPGDLLTG